MIGKSILHYRILEKLGQGGMGIVYLAEDSKLERKVAIKFLPHNIANSSDERKRFEIEAKAAAALNHPNIATIYAIEEAENEIFLVMEYIEGQELKQLIINNYHMALEYAIQIAKGLQAAHEKDIVHRDIKSSNIMVTSKGDVKIMDFGLAKFRGSVQITQTGTTVGTAAYMSPEQVKGEEADQRADIWSFGVVLYELVTGQLPFKGDYEQAISYSILHENPQPIFGLKADLPGEMEKIINKCLEKEPENRYQHVDDIIVDLHRMNKESEKNEIRSKSENSSARSGVKAKVYVPGIIALAILLLLAGYFIITAEEESNEKISIAVVDFVNESDEKELNSLSGMLITALEQSRKLSVVTRSRMFDILKQMDKADVSKIDESLGRQICQQAGINTMAIASIRKFGKLYTIDLKVIDPVKNEYLFTAKEEAEGQESIPAMLDKLSEKTRTQLNEKTAFIKESSQKVASVTTINLEAYQYYFQGEQFISKLKFDQAIEEFNKAIALDSTFALAYYRLGYAYGWNPMRHEDAVRFLEKAKAVLNRIPDKEKVLLRAEEAHLKKGYKAALSILEEGVKKYPDDKEMLYNYGDFLFHDQQYQLSIIYLEKVLQMDPAHERALDHIIRVFWELKDFDKAIAAGQSYVKKSNSVLAVAVLGRSYSLSGDFNSAFEIYRNGLDIYPDDIVLVERMGEQFILLEEYDKAENYLKTLTVTEKPTPVRIAAYKGLTQLYSYLGQYKLTYKMFDQIIELYRQENNLHMEAEYGIFKTYFMLRGGVKKEDIEKEIEKNLKVKNPGCFSFNIHLAEVYVGIQDFENAALINDHYVDENFRGVIKAQQYMSDGDWEKAASFFNSVEYTIDYSELRYQLARCYFELGKFPEALEQLRLAKDLGAGWRSLVYARNFYLTGRIYEKKGEIADAIRSYEKFMDIWKKADRDLPDLIDAEKRLTTLTGIL